MALTDAQLDRLKPTFEALYAAVKAGDLAALATSYSTLAGAAAGANPVIDPPAPSYPRITNAKEALQRAFDEGVSWRGEKLITYPGDMADARRKVAAWGGPTLDLDLVKLVAPAFYEGVSIDVRKREAWRRFGELQEAEADLRKYVLLFAPREAFTGCDPEGPIGLNGAPLQPGQMPTGGLQAYIDEQLAIEAAGGKPSGM